VPTTPGVTAGRDSLSKPCSKCKRVLPLEDFVPSPRHSFGRYPSCRQCMKETYKKTLANNPLCSKCKLRPHESGSGWCSQCNRVSKGKPPEPRWKQRKAPSPEICPACGIRPKCSDHGYCRECRRKAVRDWCRRKSGNPLKVPVLAKKTNRHYVNMLLARGKMRRGPCVFCGDPGQELHHYDYLPRTRNVDSMCKECHRAVHKILKLLLTASRYGVSVRL
jgi:hypothetical protein